MRTLVNPNLRQAAVPPPSEQALPFHAALDGYAPTPVRELSALAGELGLAAVLLKDESDRLGLPAFKVLGASWATELALAERPGAHTLVAASSGNHGRAVARVAALRNLRCRVYLPARAAEARSQAIAAEGADVIVVDGRYEDAVAQAVAAGAEPGFVEIADVGASATATWVIDGYATLFAEAAAQSAFEVILVPVGVGSLAAAAARYAAYAGVKVVGVEPVTAGCLTASLREGRPTAVENPGTSMAGLDCAEVSVAAWPSLLEGIHGTVTVDDAEVHAAVRELAASGLAIGESGAAPLAALRALALESDAAPLRDAIGLGAPSRVLLIASEGPTDPESYGRLVSGA